MGGKFSHYALRSPSWAPMDSTSVSYLIVGPNSDAPILTYRFLKKNPFNYKQIVF